MRRFVGVALLPLALAACNGDDGDSGPPRPSEAKCQGDTVMDVYSTDDGGVVHVDHPAYKGPLGNPPKYTVEPPTGGDHLSPSVGPGIYQGQNVPPDGVLVHSLEHGYVILWFRDATVLDVVREAAEEHPRDTIVVERPSLSVPVAATAWGHRLLCDPADAPALADFVETRRNKAPEKIPH